MNETVLREHAVTPIVEAKAWRITFDEVDKDPSAGTVIREPRLTAVNAQPIEVEAALADTGETDDGSLLVIWLPTGQATPANLERDVELWISQCSYYRPAVRANIRTNRVVWANTRAIIYATPDGFQDTLDAVRRFTMIARETSALEKQMKSTWPMVNKHVGLSHAVKSRQHRFQSQINKMTEMVTRMKMSYLRIQMAIEQHDAGLTIASKRLCAELVLQAGIHDRLDILDEPVQFALDHYELSNTRLTEHKAAAREMVLMGVIVILLLLQTAFIIIPELQPSTTVQLAGPGAQTVTTAAQNPTQAAPTTAAAQTPTTAASPR
jgi:hypothetical protein